MLAIRQSVPLKVGPNQHIAEILSFQGFESGKEHIALRFPCPKPGQDPVLVRLHSECLTGDVFHSSRCDCGDQLNEAIELLASDGGVLLYLRQEGRDIGLYNKLDAYALQDSGMNTYEANRHLGFSEDGRDFKEAAMMLQAMEINRITLLTNNPRKISQLEEHGIDIISVRNTSVFCKDDNQSYLETKRVAGGHQLDPDDA